LTALFLAYLSLMKDNVMSSCALVRTYG